MYREAVEKLAISKGNSVAAQLNTQLQAENAFHRDMLIKVL